MRPAVLITQPEYEKGRAVFEAASDLECRPADAAEEPLALAAKDAGTRAVIVGVTPYRGPLYAALARPEGALVARFGVGHDGIDKALARSHCIRVTNTPGTLDTSVAEHTLWLLGCLARRIPILDGRIRAGAWQGECGVELSGRTLGILGPGAIGRRVAAMARFGLGMRVIAYSRRPDAGARADNGIEHCTNDLREVLGTSDIVSLHLASVPETRHFLDTARLALLRPGAWVVNTARGALIDENALYDALVGGRLAGAALDVFEHEPYRPAAAGKDLRTLPNAILTPHVGSNTHEANRRMAEAALANVRAFLAGRADLLNAVDGL